MMSKVILVVLVTLIVVQADPINSKFLPGLQLTEEQQEKVNSFTSKWKEWQESLSSKSNQQKPTTDSQDNGIDRYLEIVSNHKRVIQEAQVKSRSELIQPRAWLSLSVSTSLNEFVKFWVDFILTYFEETVGRIVLTPVRYAAQSLLDWLLPCGLSCLQIV